MGDNADQKNAENVPGLHPSRLKISINPETRHKVVWKIVSTLQSVTPTPEALDCLEGIARKFEEKVFAVATDEKDYLRKIASKMHAVETSARAANSSPALSTSGGPNQDQSGSTSNAHSEDSKQDQPQTQTNSLNPATVQASGSKITSQSSKLDNISKMPTEKKAAEQQITPSNLASVSLGQDQIQHSLKVLQPSNLRPSLELQQPQNVRTQLPQASEQPEKQAAEQQITPSNPVPVSLGQDQIQHSPKVIQPSNLRPSLELQQLQNVRTQLPLTQQASEQPEKKASERQITPSNPVPVSLVQDQVQHSPRVLQQSDVRQSLEVQQLQNVRTQLPHTHQASEPPEEKAPEQQITPSNPVPISLGQDQIQLSPKVLQQSNLRPSLELQQPQSVRPQLPRTQQASEQPEKKPPEQQITPFNPVPVSIGLNQIQYSPKVLQRSHLRPSLELQQHQNIRPQLSHTQQTSEQPEVSSAYRRQSVTKQQYESWQRDTAHQRKSAPVQQKSMLGKYETSRELSSTLNNQQNISQPSRAHSVVQQRPNDLANAHPQRSMAGSTAHKEALRQHNVLPRDVPLAQSSGVNSMSQNVPMLDTGVIPSRSMPSAASKKIDTSSAVETHKDTHDWRDRIHERILAMRKKYLAGISEMKAVLEGRVKLLETHPDARPNRDEVLKRLEESKVMILRILKFLNIPLNEIMPVHGEKLGQWEQNIIMYINKYKRSKSGAQQSVQSLLPSQRLAPQKNVVASSTLPVSRDVEVNIQCQTQPPNSNPQMVVSNEARVNLTPIQRLLKAVSSVSPQAFKSGMEDIYSVAYLGDVMEPSAPRPTSNTGLLPIGQDLGAMTGCRLQAKNISLQNGGCNGDGARTWTPRPQMISTNPYDTPSVTESTSENYSKRRRVELLPEEIRNVNQRLIDIVVEICKENVNDGGSGTFVICRYTGVSVNLGFMKSILPAGNSSLIQPLRLLVPTEYPNCSPVILPSENDDSCEDLSSKTRLKLDLQLRCLSAPFSVSEVARKWEICARDVVIEYAGKFGGGTFSSRYGKWENYR